MFRRPPPQGGTPREVSEILNGVLNGKTNNTGLITLETGNATETIIYNSLISRDSKIILIPFSTAAFADTTPFGCFTNSNDQFAASVGSTAVVEFDRTEDAEGIYLSSDTRIYVRNSGQYNTQYSLQLANNDTQPQYADVWFRVNGTDVVRSGSRFDLPARKSGNDPSHVIGTVNLFLDLEAGDYIEIAGAVSDTDVSLKHYAADAVIPRPAIPAVILTMQYIAPLAYSEIMVTEQSNGQATISHWANDTEDKIYAYVVIA